MAAPAALPAALLNLPYPLSTYLRCRDHHRARALMAVAGLWDVIVRAVERAIAVFCLVWHSRSKFPSALSRKTFSGERKFTPLSARVLTTRADVVNQCLLDFICGWHRESRLGHRCIWPPSGNELMEGQNTLGRGGEQRLGPRLLRDEDVEMPLEPGQQIVTSPNLGTCRGSAAVAAGAGC